MQMSKELNSFTQMSIPFFSEILPLLPVNIRILPLAAKFSLLITSELVAASCWSQQSLNGAERCR